MSRAVLAGLLLLSACATASPQWPADFARGDALLMSREEEAAFAEAALGLAASRDVAHRIRLEFHLDRATVKRKRLPDRCLVAVALALGRYPKSSSARDVLWSALGDAQERDAVRAACLKSLQSFHPEDLETRVIALPCPAGDTWLADLQRRVR